jgi:transcriptional regulator with XRE-family HTH domain
MMTQGIDEDVKGRLAANLRRLRVARHLSMSALARLTSTSKATLSAIENGHGNPTVETLALLAGALNVSLSELLEEVEVGEVRIVRVSRADDRPVGGPGRRRLEVTAELHGSAEVFELSLPARHVHRMPARAAGARQGVIVLQGKLIAGPVERISELVTGDYASFPADVPHLYEAAGTAARLLVIEYPPVR